MMIPGAPFDNLPSHVLLFVLLQPNVYRRNSLGRVRDSGELGWLVGVGGWRPHALKSTVYSLSGSTKADRPELTSDLYIARLLPWTIMGARGQISTLQHSRVFD
jgi:hypothetical protein